MADSDSYELRYPATMMLWVRWVVLLALLVLVNYRVEGGSLSHVLNNLYVLANMAANGYVHFRVRFDERALGRWLMLLAGLDTVGITTSVLLSGGIASSYFVLYYIPLAWFASVFTSRRLITVWVTLVSVVYGTCCVLGGSGLDLAVYDEKILFVRIASMYAVVAVCNFISGFERRRKQEALERERELQKQRIELSQAMHDTTAQSAYMIGLGIETAIELADGANRELANKLKATYTLSQSMMWELRHPIDLGLIFEGRELSQVLKSHAETFTVITSVPAEFICVGKEPPLSLLTRSKLFSVAHNALTNAFRHACASKVVIRLDFQEGRLLMSVADDGIGLPHDFDRRGHGLRNMRDDVERMGGLLEIDPGFSGGGTTVTCVIGYDSERQVSEEADNRV